MAIKNLDIREYAEKNNIKLWQIAEELGITDGYFSKLLRKELPNEKKTQIFSIITKLSEMH